MICTKFGVFNLSTGCNFYLIVTKFGTQVGLVKIQVEFEDGLCESHRGGHPIISKAYLELIKTLSLGVASIIAFLSKILLITLAKIM